MPTGPEKPIFLQDVVTPQEREAAPKGFDIDREFGKGTKQRLEQALRTQTGVGMRRDGWYQVLFGTDLHESKDTARRTQDLRDEFNFSFKNSALALNAAHVAALSRILEGVTLESEKEAGALKKWLQDNISINLRGGDFWRLWHAAISAADHRVLFDEIALNDQDVRRLGDILRKYVKEKLASNAPLNDLEAAACAASLRILRAHEIKFIPGKGIEIIDTPQDQFTRSIPPMPEERAF